MTPNISNEKEIQDCVSCSYIYVSTGLEMIQKETMSLTSKVTAAAFNAINGVKDFFTSHQSKEIMGGLRFFALCYVPFAVYEVAKAVFEFYKTTVSEKVDAALTILSEVGGVGDAACNLAQALDDFGALGNRSISWVTPLGLVSAALGIAGIVHDSKCIIDTERFMEEFRKQAGLDKKPHKYTKADYLRGMKFLEKKNEEERTVIDKQLHVDAKDLFNNLAPTGKNRDRELKNSQLYEKMQTIAKQLENTKTSMGLSLLFNVVNVVALAILFTPVAPLGLIFLGVGGIVALTQFCYDRTSLNLLKNSLI